MKVTIEIDRMRLYAFHGVMEQERRVGNFYEVSVSLTYPVPEYEAPSTSHGDDALLPVSDELGNTVNYAEIAAIITREMAVPSNLIEHVAARIRQSVLTRYPSITAGYVKIAKLTPPLGIQLRAATATLEW